MAIPMTYRYLSSMPYSFGEEEAEAIIRTTAYHRRDYAMSVIWFAPREHADILESIATPFPRSSNAGLGFLDSLPFELLHPILIRLDIYSLFKFRQTNLRSRQVVDSLGQYQLVVSYGLNLLRALLRTRLAHGISLLEFYDDALCTKACSLCGEFSGFVSLLTWKRCCFRCLREASEIYLQTVYTLCLELRLTTKELRQLKTFKTLPGIYSLDELECKAHLPLASVCQAISLCKTQQASQEQWSILSLTPKKEVPVRHQKYNFMGSCALPYYNQLSGTVEHGVACAGCQLAIEKGIIGEKWAFDARDKQYARDGFLEHFRWCQQAQILWTASDKGSKLPAELPVLAWAGGYFMARI